MTFVEGGKERLSLEGKVYRLSEEEERLLSEEEDGRRWRERNTRRQRIRSDFCRGKRKWTTITEGREASTMGGRGATAVGGRRLALWEEQEYPPSEEEE